MNKKTIEQLERVKENGFTFEEVDKEALVDAMLKNIGHRNSFIRDDLIYPSLAHLLHEGHFSEETLTHYLWTLLDEDHLMHDLQGDEPYSVLTRSFSSLQLVVLLDVHRHQGIINRETIRTAFEIFMTYFEKETVFEGYDPSVGWMHAIAHSADVLNQFMQIPWMGKEPLKRMFNAIGTKMKQSTHLFKFNEDERMVVAIKNGMDRQILKTAYLKEWIDTISKAEPMDTLPERVYLENNIKNLLRALYFALIDSETHREITDRLRRILTKK